MKQLQKTIFPLILALILVLSTGMTVLATGEGNIDGGGGGMGSGTKTDVWHSQDGVRVTVVTTSGSVVSTPFDLTNSSIPNATINFGHVCKLQYTSGASLSPGGSYTCSRPATPLPRIISGTSSKASIEAIRRYFCSEYTAQLVASKAGIAFEELVSGSYKLVIEPIAYFTHGGRNYAMTATEAALYNQMSGGTLRSKLPSLTHQNLPLSIFLETPDLGYPAWGGTTSGKVSDAEILSALGIGIVTYKEVPAAELEATDYTYRVDTDVITSITLTSSREVNPDNPASVTFHINGRSYTVNNIVMPAGGSPGRMGQMAYSNGTYCPDDPGIRKRGIHCKDQLYRADRLPGRKPAPGSHGNGCQPSFFPALPAFQSPEDIRLLERVERKVEARMGMGKHRA